MIRSWRKQQPTVASRVAYACVATGSGLLLPGCSDDGTGTEGLDDRGTEAVATPLPEPPPLLDPDPARIAYDPGKPGDAQMAGTISIQGASNAVQPDVEVVVTNLLTGSSNGATASANGAFSLLVEADDGDWLRIEVQRDGEWSGHATFVFDNDDGELELIELPDCIELSPAVRSREPVSVNNNCEQDVTVQPPTLHPEAADLNFEPEVPAAGLLLAVDDTLLITPTSLEERVVVLLPIDVDGTLMPYSLVFEP